MPGVEGVNEIYRNAPVSMPGRLGRRDSEWPRDGSAVLLQVDDGFELGRDSALDGERGANRRLHLQGELVIWQ